MAPSDDAQLAALQDRVAKLGYALRMRYLRKTSDGKLPSVFDAWLLDRDFRNPQRSTLDVRVLLSRRITSYNVCYTKLLRMCP